MSVTVLANTIAHREKRAAIEAAVRAAIGDRPGERVLEIEILADQRRPGFQVKLRGAVTKTWHFSSAGETQPGYVRRTIESEDI